MSAINAFLLEHDLRIAQNPCISPDFCLDWTALAADVQAGRVREYPGSRFATRRPALDEMGTRTPVVGLSRPHCRLMGAAKSGT